MNLLSGKLNLMKMNPYAKKNSDCPRCKQPDSMNEIGPGQVSCVFCGYLNIEQQFQNDIYSTVKLNNNFASKQINRSAIAKKYNQEERIQFQKETKLKGHIGKLEYLTPIDQERVFKMAMEYTDKMKQQKHQKSEPYHVVVTACIYLLHKSGQLQKSVGQPLDLKTIMISVRNGHSQKIKSKQLIQTADNIKSTLQNWQINLNPTRNEKQVKNLQVQKNSELIKVVVRKFFTHFKESLTQPIESNDKQLQQQQGHSQDKQSIRLNGINKNKKEEIIQETEFNKLPSFRIDFSNQSQNPYNKFKLGVALPQSSVKLSVFPTIKIEENKNDHLKKKLDQIIKQSDNLEKSALQQVTSLVEQIQKQQNNPENDEKKIKIDTKLIVAILTYILIDEYIDQPYNTYGMIGYGIGQPVMYRDVIKVQQNEIAEIFDLNATTLNKKYKIVSDFVRQLQKTQDTNSQQVQIIPDEDRQQSTLNQFIRLIDSD